MNELQESVQHLHEQITERRQHEDDVNQELNETREQHNRTQKALLSLEATQRAAAQNDEAAVDNWLEEQHIDDKPRLLQDIQVEQGWENAVEVVLGDFLQAVCVDQLEGLADSAAQLAQGNVCLLAPQASNSTELGNKAELLLTKITTTQPVTDFLSNVYIADDLSEALQLRQRLAAHESVVTRDGMWLGGSWLRVQRSAAEQGSMIEREQSIKELREQFEQEQDNITRLSEEREETRRHLGTLQEQRDERQQQLREANNTFAEINAELNQYQSRLEQLQQRIGNVTNELADIEQQRQHSETELAQAKENKATAANAQAHESERRENLQTERQALQQQFDEAQQKARAELQQVDELQVRVSTTESQQHMLQENARRAEKQLANLKQRRVSAQQNLAKLQEPLPELKQQLIDGLEQRSEAEKEFTTAKQKNNEIEQGLREQEQQRDAVSERIESLRSQLEKLRIQSESLQVHCQNHEEQIAELEFDLQQLLASLEEGAQAQAWHENLEQVQRRIKGLGAINLAAIEEYSALLERKEHLDEQHKDLVEALETLTNAINKIDKETKARFREVFDKVNENFGVLFPKVFGGGKAYLELTDDDLLTTGIKIMAQPPGKRNSTIHLLSGGEKALTAISLVFALFQLTPAPFCILDEVDAPLDDANVGRFCNLVKEMSKQVQFIYISHNKLTISMAEQLAGVTMQEAGVSRLVSVDINKALSMVEEA